MESQLLYLSSILGLGILAQWLAWRLHLPSILLLLAFGFASGELLELDIPINEDLLFAFVSLSVAVILFEGGMSLKISELAGTGRIVVRLVTLGALVTWVLTTSLARSLLDLDWPIAALLGAILIVTGPTVVGPLLRHIRPAKRIGSIVKWEGIVIDPIGAVLAVLVFGAITTIESANEVALDIAVNLMQTIVIGIGIGMFVAKVLIQLLKRYWIPDFLHNVVILAAVVTAFTASNILQHESGLLTVTVLGMLLSNQKQVTVNHIFEFKENLRVLLISVLFVVLSSRVKLEDLQQLGWQGPAFIAGLLLVVRPAAIWISTFRADLTWRERVFLAWLAPRGIVAAAVASVFSLELMHIFAKTSNVAFTEQAEKLVPITFLVIVGTVAIYGLTAAPLARLLKLSDANPQGVLIVGANAWIRSIALALQQEGIAVILVDTNFRNISAARMAGLTTCNASVLSEFVEENLELNGVGKLMAMTPNDEINSLSALEFSHVFGRANVFQLAMPTADSERNAHAIGHLRGRSLFGETMTYSYLNRRFAAGAQIKTTTLTDEFTFDDFTAIYGNMAEVLFTIDPEGKLSIRTEDQPPKYNSGQKLISLVDGGEE